MRWILKDKEGFQEEQKNICYHLTYSHVFRRGSMSVMDTGTIVMWGNPFENCTDYIIVTPPIKVKVLEMMNKYGEWEE